MGRIPKLKELNRDDDDLLDYLDERFDDFEYGESDPVRRRIREAQEMEQMRRQHQQTLRRFQNLTDEERQQLQELRDEYHIFLKKCLRKKIQFDTWEDQWKAFLEQRSNDEE
jgi:hypothetical protein